MSVDVLLYSIKYNKLTVHCASWIIDTSILLDYQGSIDYIRINDNNTWYEDCGHTYIRIEKHVAHHLNRV